MTSTRIWITLALLMAALCIPSATASPHARSDARGRTFAHCSDDNDVFAPWMRGTMTDPMSGNSLGGSSSLWASWPFTGAGMDRAAKPDAGTHGYPEVLSDRGTPGITGSSTTTAFCPIAAGISHTVATRSDGTVWCWGWNSTGQLGDGTTTNSSSPVQAYDLSEVTGVAAGFGHTVALRTDGTVSCWGWNYAGMLGSGTTTDSSTPVPVGGLSGVTAVAAGFTHTVALRSDGTVWCWGDNWCGQLGNGGTIYSPTPIQVSNSSNVTAVAAGTLHTVALRTDGTVWCWGYNSYGQLGNGTTIDSSTPVQASGLSGVTAVAAGDCHTVALRSDGTVWCWGDNSFGQLGNGARIGSTTPVQVNDLSGVAAVAAGIYHTMAARSDGTVWCWGYNSNGQLGNGTTIDSLVPVQVGGLSGVTAVAAGIAHAVALRSDGTVWTWGSNDTGELGNGTTVDSPLPVQVLATDQAAPVCHILTPADSAMFASSEVTATWTATDRSGGTPADQLLYSYQIDMQEWSAYSTVTEVTLSGLADGSHTLRVKAKDLAGNESAESVRHFSTCSAPPAISAVAATGSGSVCVVTWTTDTPATSQVDYGPTDTYGSSTALDIVLVSAHSVMISGLESGQVYHYRVRSKDILSRESVSPDATFTTITCPDLTVDGNVQAPSQAASGDTVSVTWSAKNIGSADAVGPWDDAVFLSADDTLDSQDIPLQAFVTFSGSLAPEVAYPQPATASVMIPPRTATGDYFLIVAVDANNVVSETDETDNTRASALHVDSPPRPDLRAHDLVAPAAAIAGSRQTFSFSVTNDGQPTNQTDYWFDAVYLSTDDQFDTGDTRLGTMKRDGVVDPNGTYDVSVQADLPELDPRTEPYYLFAVVDSTDALIEPNESNTSALRFQ